MNHGIFCVSNSVCVVVCVWGGWGGGGGGGCLIIYVATVYLTNVCLITREAFFCDVNIHSGTAQLIVT